MMQTLEQKVAYGLLTFVNIPKLFVRLMEADLEAAVVLSIVASHKNWFAFTETEWEQDTGLYGVRLQSALKRLDFVVAQRQTDTGTEYSIIDSAFQKLLEGLETR